MGGLFVPVEGTVIAKSTFGAIAPRFSGGLSALSSLLIIYVILRGDKKLSTVYHRIVFSMSCADVVGSIAMALTTLPMPSIDPDIELKMGGYDIRQFSGKRLGTVQTCRAQGFLVVFGFVTMFGYNVTLCVYYACVIAFKMKEATIKKRVEPFLHLAPLVVGPVSASLPLIIGDFYNPAADPWCTLSEIDSALPYQLKVGPNERRPRDRLAQEIGKFLIALFLFLIVFAFALIIARIVYMGRRLRHIASRMGHNSPRFVNRQLEHANRTHQNTKVIVIQAAWYIFAFAISLIFALVRLILIENIPFVDGGQFLLMPLQGFFNALIFFGHKIYNYRRTHPDVSRAHVFCLFLQGKASDPILMSRISLVEINDGTMGGEDGADNNIVMRLEVSDENGEHEMLSSSPSVDHRDESYDDSLEEGNLFEGGLSYPSDISHQDSDYGNDAFIDTNESRNLDNFSYISSFSSTTPKKTTDKGSSNPSCSTAPKSTNIGSSNLSLSTGQKSTNTGSSNLSCSTAPKSTNTGSSDLSFSTGQKSTNTGSSNLSCSTAPKSTNTGSSDLSLSTGQKSTNTGSSNLSFSRSGGDNAESIQEEGEL